jgi:hypothetical protein
VFVTISTTAPGFDRRVKCPGAISDSGLMNGRRAVRTVIRERNRDRRGQTSAGMERKNE